MLKISLLICILALISCADIKDAGSDNKVYTLTWVSPSIFEDLSPLDPGADLSEYRIYYGDSSGNVLQKFITIGVGNTSFSTKYLDASIVSSMATVYVAMTSISNNGVESVLSDRVSFVP